MNRSAIPALPAQTPPPIHRRKRFWVAMVIIIGLLALAARVASNLTTMRASGIRAGHHAELRNIALAMRVYQEQTGRIGTPGDLIAAGHITHDQTVRFASVQYNAIPTPGPRLLFVQRAPEPPVKQGDPWGGPGETADRDIPACRYVMFDDLMVTEVVEDEYQKTLAPQIILKP